MTDHSLQRQALLDLARRADRGMPVHLALWVAICWSSGLFVTQPVAAWGQTVLFAANLALRLALRQRFEVLVERRMVFARRAYLSLLLGNALNWGLLGCLASAGVAAFEPAALPIWFALTGLAASGCLALSIDPVVRLSYPLVTMGPPLIPLAITQRHGLFLPLGDVLFIVYMIQSSGAIHADYWIAARARAELERRSRELEIMSFTDALTRIPNRRFFENRLDAEWARAAREGRPLTVMIIDLDHFKRINDTHGHPFGDLCLQAVASALQAALHRPGDVLARYGGEEFAALMPDTSDRAVPLIAQRLLAAVSRLRIDHAGAAVALTCSIGVCSIVPSLSSGPLTAVEMADQALYGAKAQGRNRFVVKAA